MIENNHNYTKLPCPLVQGITHSGLQLASRSVAADGHLLMLDMPPHWLDQVQLGAVRRQIEEPDASRLQSTQLLLDLPPVMGGVVVQHDRTWPASLVPRGHFSHRSGHLADLMPDELQHITPFERGATCGICQSRVLTQWSQSADHVYPSSFRRFVRHDSPHSLSRPGVANRQCRSKTRLVHVVQLDETFNRFPLQRFKVSKATLFSAWSLGSFCLWCTERTVRFHRKWRSLSLSLRYTGLML